MNDKLTRAQEAYNSACEKRDAAYTALEEASDDTPAEDLSGLTETFDTAQADVERSLKTVKQLEKVIEARANTPAIELPSNDSTSDTNTAANASTVSLSGQFQRVKGLKAEQTYRPDNGTSFFRDLFRATTRGDLAAQQRLNQHDRETRDLTTVATDGGGFVPPLYMGELWAKVPRQGRPFANALAAQGNVKPLADKGMTITLPRVTTAPATAFQTTENTAFNETELVEATLSIPVTTLGGIEDVSIQLLERSDPPIDDVIWISLRDSYDTLLDYSLINGSGTGATNCGLVSVSGINTTTYTDATPTAAETVPPIYEAISEVATNRFRQADMIIMHPRRAAWLAGTLASTQSLFQLGSLTNAVGQQDLGFVGNFAGLKVVLDANVTTTNGASTNEDQIIVLYSPDQILWESGLRAEVFRETLSAEGTVRLRLYGHSAWASERYPSSISVVSGTGLVAPTFA